MSKYAVVIERYDDSGFGAYVPDLPGCFAAASTRHEVQKLISEAIGLHIESLRNHGNPVPEPTTGAEYIEPAAVA